MVGNERNGLDLRLVPKTVARVTSAVRRAGPHGTVLAQMLGKPLLLVDIDGVISLWGWDADMRPGGTWTLVDGIAHFLSTEAAQHLLDLRSDFDLVWCSGWEEKADETLPRAIGLGPFPHLSFDRPVGGRTAPRAHWKLDAIDAHAGPERPLAWVDDAFNPACHAWAAERSAPTLLVATEPATGLVAEHAGRLRAWARALAPG